MRAMAHSVPYYHDKLGSLHDALARFHTHFTKGGSVNNERTLFINKAE